jgi:hypothetical protein
MPGERRNRFLWQHIAAIAVMTHMSFDNGKGDRAEQSIRTMMRV